MKLFTLKCDKLSPFSRFSGIVLRKDWLGPQKIESLMNKIDIRGFKCPLYTFRVAPDVGIAIQRFFCNHHPPMTSCLPHELWTSVFFSVPFIYVFFLVTFCFILRHSSEHLHFSEHSLNALNDQNCHPEVLLWPRLFSVFLLVSCA